MFRFETNQFTVVPYYAVLINRDDTKEMVGYIWIMLMTEALQRFASDMVTYLSGDTTGRESTKCFNVIMGMDTCAHTDILPLNVTVPMNAEFKSPIEHDLFKLLFKLMDDSKPG